LFKTPERKDRRYGKGGVLLESEGTRYVYDGEGNLTGKAAADGSQWKYAWNGDGTLAKVTRPDGEEVAFRYDALKRRVEKTSSAGTTRWLWDGNVPVHEVTGTGEQAQTTTWVFEPGTFSPVGKIGGDGRKYSVVTDYLGTPTEMVDEAGRVAWRAQLDVYGVGRADVGGAGDCPWRWPGQYEDAETGLCYNRFRYYDPARGDYLSQDPIRLLGGAEVYAYTRDPTTWVDPFGLAGCGKGAKGVNAYEVGNYENLLARSHVGDDLALHHVGQAHAMEQIVSGYERPTAPSIALPTGEHRLIPNLRGTVNLTPRQLLARDIWNLRTYTNAPNESLMQLIQMNRDMYPGAFLP
jgi:RHS repeat-associated protein